MLLRSRARWTSAAAVLGALFLTAAVAGQGTFGALPDPITTRELLGLLGRLEPTPAQIEAAERAHDAYKAAFGQLRDGQIADYLRDLRAGDGRRFPDRRRVDRLAAAAATLRTRIERLDEELFGAIEPVLTDDQRLALPRVRLERARARLLDERLRIPTEAIVDLAAIARSVATSPPDRLAVGPVLAEYEIRLTERLRALLRLHRDLDRALLDHLESLGFVPGDLDDPERREQVFAAMRAYWSHVEREIVRLTEDARRLGRSTCDRTTPLLSPVGRRRLRDAYYRAAYPDLDAEFPALVELLRRVESDEQLDAEQRRAVVTLREGYEASADTVLARAADALDVFFAEQAPFDFDTPAERRLEEALAREASVAMIGHEMAVLQLREIVGPAGVERYDLNDVEAVIEIAMGVRATETELASAQADLDAAEPDLMPSPLTDADVTALVALLGTDAPARETVDAAAAAHRGGYREARTSLDAVMDHATRSIERLEEDPEAEIDPAAVLDRVYAARRRFREAAAGLDAAFLERVASAGVAADAWPRLEAWRRARARAASAIGTDPELLPGGSHEALIDLLSFVAAADVDRAALAPIEREVVAHEEAIGAVVSARWALAEQYLEASDRWAFAAESARPVIEERLDDLEARLGAAGVEIVLLNRAMLARIVAAVGAESGAALASRYARAAHPDVYDDPEAVGPALSRTLGRDDLGPAARTALAGLASTYRPTYEATCRAMIETEERAAQGAIDPIEHADRMARLRFERDELNARAERRLRALTGPAGAPPPR